jgi:hypothetical protein
VNLREPRPDQRTDASLIARVRGELQAMGIPV